MTTEVLLVASITVIQINIPDISRSGSYDFDRCRGGFDHVMKKLWRKTSKSTQAASVEGENDLIEAEDSVTERQYARNWSIRM